MDPMTKHLSQFLKGNYESLYRMKRGLGIYQSFSLSVSNNRFTGTNKNAVNNERIAVVVFRDHLIN
jgi:hypothetical protein